MVLLPTAGLLARVQWPRESPRRLTAVVSLACGVAALAVAASHTGGATASVPPATLVQLTRQPAGAEQKLLAAAGARLVAPELRLWRIPAGRAPGAVAVLRASRVLAFAQKEREYAVMATSDFSDPLVAGEWWRAVVGVSDLTPPGPGVPVALVDSGVSFGHPEFVGRPDLVALNPQEPAPIGGVHGTAVASVVGAPVNGVGLVGIYPQAVLRSYDAAIGDGTRLASSEIVSGILAAARAGKSVINLSLGADSKDAAIERAVGEAVRRGSLVVAASGNSGDAGNPLTYPAALPHVLTVAATDTAGRVAFFSSRSSYVDLAAPGVDIPVASALDDGYTVESGTSFAAPIVSGAAAWLWTVRPELDAGQVAEILRRSARDVEPAGVDQATGHGMLDLPAALSYPTPAIDPGEPNDDVGQARNRALLLTTKARTSVGTTGRVTTYEDPRDVLHVWLPAGKTFSVVATSSVPAGLTVALFRDSAPTVAGQAAPGDRVTLATGGGTRSTLSFRNAKSGRWAFLVVAPAKGARDVDYTLRATVR